MTPRREIVVARGDDGKWYEYSAKIVRSYTMRVGCNLFCCSRKEASELEVVESSDGHVYVKLLGDEGHFRETGGHAGPVSIETSNVVRWRE